MALHSAEENLQRVMLHLPVGENDQSKDAVAYGVVKGWLYGQKRITGLTESANMQGFWKGPDNWITEPVRVLTIDLDAGSLDIKTYVARLEAVISRIYRDCGTPQLLYWFIVCPVKRISCVGS